MRRPIRASKKKHEVARWIRRQTLRLQEYYFITERLDSMTTYIADDGVGYFYVPSQSTFQYITPQSSPTGMVFLDDSFLLVKHIFRYDYPTEDASKPTICNLEYSYHYQRPSDNSFFRYDFHPDVGDAETHPLYHLHASGWLPDAIELPSVPRFPVATITLDEVLELIRINFFL